MCASLLSRPPPYPRRRPPSSAVACACGVPVPSLQDVVSEVMRLTGGKGVRVVYDGVGKATFEASLACLARLGSMISFGNASGKVRPPGGGKGGGRGAGVAGGSGCGLQSWEVACC